MTFNTRSERMWRRNQNTTRFVPSATLGPVAHTVLVALMIAVLGLIYLTQVTKTSTYGYQLDSLQTKKSSLMAERQDLENENARLQALERLKTSTVASAMTQPASVEYANN
jgi:Tfp pilus assembly protein PilN